MTHELDENGQIVHVDFDPQIPTGFCVICADETPIYDEVVG